MFSFFRRKKKQETPAPEKAQVQETAAKVESEVVQVVENIKRRCRIFSRKRQRAC